MNTAPAPPPADATGNARRPAYYGWVVVLVASVAMVGTFPGRSVGRGLITEPLLADLSLDRLQFSWITFFATLIGSAFSPACGPLIDRLGTRVVLTANAALLGGATLAMSQVHSPAALAITLTLTLGLGQSALSVVSLAVIGKWFVRRIDAAMAVFAAVVSVGFIAAFVGVGAAVKTFGWRPTWAGIGWALLAAVAPLAALLVRRTPESIGLAVDGSAQPSTPHEHRSAGLSDAPPEALTGATLSRALRTPAFWVFAISAAAFNLVFTGVTTFAEAIVRERGFYDARTFMTTGGILAAGGLVANFVGGYLARKIAHNRLLAAGMLIVTAALLVLPLGHGAASLYVYGALMGLAGGVVTVVFFAFWAKAFGRAHLGKIQGAAQVLTVLASSLGPVILSLGEASQGSIAATFLILAPIIAVLAGLCWFVPVPTPYTPTFSEILPDRG